METYDNIGLAYAKRRRPDARIASAIRAAIAGAKCLVNVGAGTGSYEPEDMLVTAVEPSWQMLSQRTAGGATLVRAVAERLPFKDASFDVALGVLTAHHWQSLETGLGEMARVARERVVILTWDPEHPGFWLTQDYFPEVLRLDRARFPALGDFAAALGRTRVDVVPIPADCADGFLGAYWRRPAAYLDPEVRRSISTFARIEDLASGLARLRSDLQDGTWLERNRSLISRDEIDLGYRLVVADKSTTADAGPTRRGRTGDFMSM